MARFEGARLWEGVGGIFRGEAGGGGGLRGSEVNDRDEQLCVSLFQPIPPMPPEGKRRRK